MKRASPFVLLAILSAIFVVGCSHGAEQVDSIKVDSSGKGNNGGMENDKGLNN